MALYRTSLLADIQRQKRPPADAWTRALLAMLLASRAGLTIRDVLKRLRIPSIDRVEDSAALGDFIQEVARLPPAASASVSPLDIPAGSGVPFSRHTPERITHVGLYSLKSPSSETVQFKVLQ